MRDCHKIGLLLSALFTSTYSCLSFAGTAVTTAPHYVGAMGEEVANSGATVSYTGNKWASAATAASMIAAKLSGTSGLVTDVTGVVAGVAVGVTATTPIGMVVGAVMFADAAGHLIDDLGNKFAAYNPNGYSYANGSLTKYDGEYCFGNTCAKSPEQAWTNFIQASNPGFIASSTCYPLDGGFYHCDADFYYPGKSDHYYQHTGGVQQKSILIHPSSADWTDFFANNATDDVAKDALQSMDSNSTVQSTVVKTDLMSSTNPTGTSITQPNTVNVPSAATGMTTTATNTSTTTTTNADGTTSKSQTEQDVSFNDGPFGDLPALWTRKYPDGFSGVIAAHANSGANSNITALLKTLTDGAPNSGSCPSWDFSFNLGKLGNYGSGNIAPSCDIWPIIKTVVLITALFLARSLVFGG